MFARLATAALAVCASHTALAGLPQFCERSRESSALEQDRVLRFAGAVKAELDRAGAPAALIARAGLDLSRFGLLYSHSGIVLRDPTDGAWAVRQLYYACDESRARLFDQGVAGFALGADTPARGHITLLFPPPAASAALAQAAADKPLALALQAGQYSANAYAFGTRYQNCNQWVIELLAAAWGGLHGSGAPREQAQQWLRAQGYTAGPVPIGSHWLMFGAQFVPLVHVNDHPIEDIQALALQVSVPDAIAAFVQRRAPHTQRVELCHDNTRIVVRRGGQPLGRACQPQPGDEVIALDQELARPAP